jgi:hypothetical protein
MEGHLTLHEARVKSNIDLDALSARTSLSSKMLRRIDEGRFEELPPGLYARSYVKSFAAEVGLDPVEALKAVEHLLPAAPDPLPVWRELRGPTVSDRLTAFVERVRARQIAPAATGDEVGTGEARDHDQHAELLRWHLTRLGAAAVDAMVLIAMNAALVLLVAVGTALPPGALLREASGALATLCAVPTALYFVLFKGIAGRTLGSWLCRLPEPPPHSPLTLDVILRRSLSPGSISTFAGTTCHATALTAPYRDVSAGIPIRRHHSA